ncbi:MULTISPECIES: hypothetical protein [Microbacterium]|uniref:Antitoxin VbhA domain-containing protein n=1 Tax=Microbacterium marmarense TaxID=3122051 RepID=A0ABU8LW03_9MICO
MPTPEESAAARKQRAEEVMKAVADGANVSDETLKLSNEFTDEWTSRIVARLKRTFRR